MVEEDDASTQMALQQLKEAVTRGMPPSDIEMEGKNAIVLRTVDFTTILQYAQQFFTQSLDDPGMQQLSRDFTMLSGVKDFLNPKLSLSLVICAVLHRYYYMCPEQGYPKPFLWLYSGALPAVDSALLSCVRGCHAATHFADTIPFFDNHNGVDVAKCVLMWRDGLLDGLKASSTRAENAKVLSAAKKRCNVAVLRMDLPESEFFPLVVKALDESAYIILQQGLMPTAGALEFQSSMYRYYIAQTTRAGQIITFQNGQYLCRLRQPIHKMRLSFCMDADRYT
ncbi:hypothetical protein KIPB_014842, partial [Kipferlia bialata]